MFLSSPLENECNNEDTEIVSERGLDDLRIENVERSYTLFSDNLYLCRSRTGKVFSVS